MKINPNSQALNTYRQLSTNTSNTSNTIDRSIVKPDTKQQDPQKTSNSNSVSSNPINVSISKEGQALSKAQTTATATPLAPTATKTNTVTSAGKPVSANYSPQRPQRSVSQNNLGENKIQQKADQAALDSPQKAADALKSVNDMITKQASNARMAQANQSPQSVLQLLK
ncbi:hypothetical protein QE109_15110 [Fusibacter bizertensis]|uniref:Flagellin C-terminal domain-containing protein n=1 Tax=Fusibacter bizertensis TaxID=1488331 RepID=A0ABT6NGE6_9FIRM|nr:hypothetical protein [Fusibacter bizertensis]MDH8679486.1 hypothetical protein [Fusibacter bizertensis]